MCGLRRLVLTYVVWLQEQKSMFCAKYTQALHKNSDMNNCCNLSIYMLLVAAEKQLHEINSLILKIQMDLLIRYYIHDINRIRKIFIYKWCSNIFECRTMLLQHASQKSGWITRMKTCEHQVGKDCLYSSEKKIRLHRKRRKSNKACSETKTFFE